jgi:hypothetical protein
VGVFNPNAKQLWQEINEAERLRDEHIRSVADIVKEYTGRWYRGPKAWGTETVGFDDYDINPEPFSYSFVTNLLPTLIFDVPKVNVRARRVVGHAEISQAMQSGLNALFKDIEYRDDIEAATLNMLFARGVLLHYIEDDTRWSAGAVRPNCKSIDYKNFGIDSLASCVDDSEFMFHCYWVDIDDVQQDPAARPEVVQMLKPQTKDAKESNEPFEKGQEGSLNRRRVKLYSVWLRRENKIRVLVECGKDCEDLYDPRDYYGPPCGPYTLFDAYPVPNEPWPLAPLVAVRDQVLDLQRHAKAMSRSAAGRKTIIIVAGEQNDLADDVKDAKDREVIEVKGFSKDQIEQVELGGFTPVQQQYLLILRDRLDQHSGLSQTVRGAAGQADTATEASIMDQAFSQRIEYLKQRVREAVKHSCGTLGWFMFHTTGIIIPVTLTDLNGMEHEGMFFGGPTPGQNPGTWQDYSISIEPYSMQRESEAVKQRRMMDFINLIGSYAPQMPQMPWIRWPELMRAAGEAINVQDPERFFNYEILGMMSHPQMQLVSSYLGQDGNSSMPPRYFSLPGMGMTARAAEDNSNASPAVDDRRSDSGADFGRSGGGTQGPPGSRFNVVPGQPA